MNEQKKDNKIHEAIEIFNSAFNVKTDKVQFEYKHYKNPYRTKEPILFYMENDEILGINAFLGMNFNAENKIFKVAQSCDTAVVKKARGKGVFSNIIKTAQLSETYDFMFGFPNEKSYPGFLKLGWVTVAYLKTAILPIRPIHFMIRKKNFLLELLDSLYICILKSIFLCNKGSDYNFSYLDGVDFSEREIEQINEWINIGPQRSATYFNYKINNNKAHKFKCISCYQNDSLQGYILFHIYKSKGRSLLEIDDWFFENKKCAFSLFSKVVFKALNQKNIDLIYVPLLNKKTYETKIWKSLFFIIFGNTPVIISPECKLDKTVLSKICVRNIDTDTILNKGEIDET